MDTYLTIASKRDQRAYTGTPIRDDVVRRILDAGRLSGSARNAQDWTFVLVETRRAALADAVWEPGNVLGAQLVVAICGGARPMDVGRCAQNMLLCAWNEGVTSCPAMYSKASCASTALRATAVMEGTSHSSACARWLVSPASVRSAFQCESSLTKICWP